MAERRRVRESHIFQVFFYVLAPVVIASAAKQSIKQQSKCGLLRRFAPRNDGKDLSSFLLAPFAPILSHFATHWGRGLSSGTSPERIAPESLTLPGTGFVHRNISRWR
ncbi:hypothetical protein [Bradyrhizobium sp. AZCC 2289]|uniref:hypothetical protein n=1 Tax=Bradyrhizobium sp. AZCC 2289 TaxID=3117026 RepID=UPI002FF2E30A